jgi:uncharacterized protein YecT (DUF1311 family)
MDCAKASLPTDKAICSDPTASAADQALNAAYSVVLARSSELEKKQLLQSQRAWLKSRTNICLGDDNKPSVKCLIEQTRKRSFYLQGKPESGPGTGHDLMPIVIEQSATKTRYERDMTVSKFLSPTLPGEKLFDTEVEKLLKDAPFEKDKNDTQDSDYVYDLDLHVTYASPTFLSATMDTYSFEGGAHGNSGTTGLNIDVAKGKMIAFEDVFESSAHKKLEEECLSQIKAQKKEKGGELDPDPKEMQTISETIAGAIGKFDSWSISATQAIVTFDPYAIGSYAEGSYSCAFPIESLKPLYKAGSILP